MAAFEHSGVARRLVHLLKYQGVTEVAEMVAHAVSPRLPALSLVPVPRAMSRRLRYGVDPARVLALAIARHTGADVVSALRPPLHSPRRAGHNRDRAAPAYRARITSADPVILVDDVVTSGATLSAASVALRPGSVRIAVAACAVPGMSNVQMA